MQYSDPNTEAHCKLLNSEARNGGVAISGDQLGALAHLYGFDLSKDTDCPASELMFAGAVRNLMRHAEADGMRLIALMAQWLSEGQDPVKLLVSLADEAGLDTRGLGEWAHEDCPYGKGV